MKKLVLFLGTMALGCGISMASMAANAEKGVDYFEEWVKDNPALEEEMAVIYKDHPGWRGAMWGDEVKMKWVLDNAEKHPMAALHILEYADGHPGFAEWAWEHPVMAKKTAVYGAARKRAALFAAKHPGMAKWVKDHPVKADWIKKHLVTAKKVIKREVEKKRKGK
jgi:hypothetical protein